MAEVDPRALVAAALRRERERAGVSLSELARLAGIAKSTLSQLESGEGNPSIETLWALAVALDVPFSQLVDPPQRVVRLIRAGEAPVIPSSEANYASALLSTSPPGARRDLYLVSGEPGSPRISEPHNRGTVEHIVLCTGRARVGPLDEPVELAPGDYLAYPGDEPHVFDALEPGTTAVTLSEHS